VSLVPTYVRARDGAWYREPVLVFAEGFVCFDDEEPPELILWRLGDGTFPDPVKVLRLVLGDEHGAFGLSTGKEALRVVPGSEPPVFQPAAGHDFQLSRRIPVPTLDDGDERRLSRVGPHHAIDLPAHPSDAHELHIPKRD
tara:strand:+ start:41076 stop:41498 length:423 start_codon:yes stop_codon:yes gene_type:complete